MKSYTKIFLSALFFVQSGWADEELCVRDPLRDFKNISQHIEENPTISETIHEAEFKILEARNNKTAKPSKIVTGDHEIKKLISQNPYPIEFMIYPHSEVTILKWSDEECGIKIAVKGKVSSSGDHPVGNVCVEMQTEETEIIPEGTSYMAETGALNNALAELDEEMGLNDRVPSGTEEKISVQKGSIQVRLRKAYKKGTRIKYTKVAVEKTKSKRKAKLKSKTKSKMFALKNEKIKLKAKSKLKIKRNRKLKKQVAEIEVITPE